MRFVFLFSQDHLDFRIAEIRGICEALRVNFDESQLNSNEHVFIVEVEDEESVNKLLSRSMLLKSAYQHLYLANSYEDLQNQIEKNSDLLKAYDLPNSSFCVRVRPIGRKKGVDCLGTAQKISSWLPLDEAPVSLNSPDNTFVAIEEYADSKDEHPCRIYFSRLIGDGQTRLQTAYNLRERCYIGNTTMDPCLSFIQANIAAVRESSIVLDPFMGTGGLLLPAAEFGAFVIGTEVNYAVARGIGRSSRQGVTHLTENESVSANFMQYGTKHRLLSVLISDASKHGVWRAGTFVDAIVADPPYGLREKARKIGKKERKEHWTLPSAEHPERFPEKQRYSLEDTFVDLVNLAAEKLEIGGRVSFWFPVILKSYTPDCLPYHPAMELIGNCEQPLTTKTSRRLLTYKKIRPPMPNESTQSVANLYAGETYRDAVMGT